MSITIQHCTNCNSHRWNTRHNEARYKDLFKEFERKFKELGFKVILIKNPRVGSFEIALGQYNLFSKMETGQFPNVDEVVDLVNQFSKVENKMERYREIKKWPKNVERREFERTNFRILNKRPVSGKTTHSFSSLKHTREYKKFNQSQKMSLVLKNTRYQASLSSSRTVFQLQQQFSSTARSRFFHDKKSINPEEYERLTRSEVMTRQERDSMGKYEKFIEKNKRRLQAQEHFHEQ